MPLPLPLIRTRRPQATTAADRSKSHDKMKITPSTALAACFGCYVFGAITFKTTTVRDDQATTSHLRQVESRSLQAVLLACFGTRRGGGLIGFLVTAETTCLVDDLSDCTDNEQGVELSVQSGADGSTVGPTGPQGPPGAQGLSLIHI